MPLYSFRCEKCGTIFDIRASINEREAGLSPSCPKCGSAEARQIIVAASVIRNSYAAPTALCCGPNTRSGCCG